MFASPKVNTGRSPPPRQPCRRRGRRKRRRAVRAAGRVRRRRRRDVPEPGRRWRRGRLCFLRLRLKLQCGGGGDASRGRGFRLGATRASACGRERPRGVFESRGNPCETDAPRLCSGADDVRGLRYGRSQRRRRFLARQPVGVCRMRRAVSVVTRTRRSCPAMAAQSRPSELRRGARGHRAWRRARASPAPGC